MQRQLRSLLLAAVVGLVAALIAILAIMAPQGGPGTAVDTQPQDAAPTDAA
jgi:hypothetical protein